MDPSAAPGLAAAGMEALLPASPMASGKWSRVWGRGRRQRGAARVHRSRAGDEASSGKEEPASPSSPALLGCAMADLAGGSSVIWTRHLTCPATVALPVLARDEGRRRGEGGGAPLAVCRRGRPRRHRGSGRRRSGRLGEVDDGNGGSC